MMKRNAGSIEYALISSNSASRVSVHVEPGGVRVYAPRHARLREIDRIVAQHAGWIREQQARLAPPLPAAAKACLAKQAKDVICERIAHFAPLLGPRRPARVTIREQKTRWGRCSRKGNLNFIWKLLRAPREALDYVVVHELCHLYEFNHSARFWRMVESVLPDYAQWKLWLAQHGQNL